MSRACGVSDTPRGNKDFIPDLLRAMMVSVKDGKISNHKTMGKRL